MFKGLTVLATATSLFLLAEHAKCSDENNCLDLQLQQCQELINQNNPDDRIYLLSEADQLHSMPLRGNTLIWYEMCGIKHIDDEVINLLIGFDRQFSHDMAYFSSGSNNGGFKIVIDATNIAAVHQNLSVKAQTGQDGVVRRPVELVVLKPDELTPIPLGKFLSFKYHPNSPVRMDYQMLYEKISSLLVEFQEINLSTLRDTVKKMGNKPYEAWIVMAAPHIDGVDDTNRLRSAQKKMAAFIKSKGMFSQFCCRNLLVTDEQSLRFLGIEGHPGSSLSSENIFLIVPAGENIVTSGTQVNIEGQLFNIYKVGGSNPTQIHQCLVFPPFMEKSHADALYLRFNVDLNQNVAETLRHLYQTLRDEMRDRPESAVAQMPKVLSFETPRNRNNSQGLQIFVEANNFDKIMSVYSEGCKFLDEEKRQLMAESHKWKFDFQKQDLLPQEVTAKDIERFLHPLLLATPSQKSAISHFDTETKTESEKKIKQYHSERITGEEYASIIKSEPGKCKVIFHFSEHCYSCNKFKHIYEEIAGERKEQMSFYRIDNDKNKAGQGIRNYNSTPIFVLYRNGVPFYFKNVFFTKKIFEEFLDITLALSTFPESVLDQRVSERAASEQLVRETLS